MSSADQLSNVQIRPFRLGDPKEESATVDLINLCYRQDVGWTGEHHIVQGLRTTLQDIRREAETSTVFVAVDSLDGVIASVKTGLVDRTLVGPLPQQAGSLGLLAVHPRFQSRGLGTRLVKHAESFCRGEGARQMVMDVLDVRSDILQWYVRLGYSKTGKMVDATPTMQSIDSVLLKPANFLLLTKPLAM